MFLGGKYEPGLHVLSNKKLFCLDLMLDQNADEVFNESKKLLY